MKKISLVTTLVVFAVPALAATYPSDRWFSCVQRQIAASKDLKAGSLGWCKTGSAELACGKKMTQAEKMELLSPRQYHIIHPDLQKQSIKEAEQANAAIWKSINEAKCKVDPKEAP